MEKERPAHGVAEIGRVIGDVKGKVAVIVDDIIDTGGTLAAAAQTVMDEGAERSTRSRPTASSRATRWRTWRLAAVGHRRHRHDARCPTARPT